MRHNILDFICFMHYDSKCKESTEVPGKYGRGLRAGKADLPLLRAERASYESGQYPLRGLHGEDDGRAIQNTYFM